MYFAPIWTAPFYVNSSICITFIRHLILNNCIGFSTPHQYMIFYSGMIYSRLEWFLPVWNDSFQTKLSDHGKCKISQQQKEIGKKIFQIQFTNIEHEFWGWLSYPNSGMNPEWFIPSWNEMGFCPAIGHSILKILEIFCHIWF